MSNPIFSINFTPLLKSCLPNQVTLINIQNDGTGTLQSIKYGISSMVPYNEPSRIALASYLNTSSCSFLIHPSVLLDATTYILTATITNFLLESTTQYFKMTTLKSSDPYISLVKGGPYRVYQQIAL